VDSPLDTISRRLLQTGLVLLALFVPFSIAGASNAIGLGTVAWLLYSYSRRDRLYERLGRDGDVDARNDPFLFVSLLLVLSAVPSVFMSENLGRALADWRSYWLLLVHFLVAAHARRVRVAGTAYWVLLASASASCLVAFVQRAGGFDLGVLHLAPEHRAGGTLYTMTFAGILTQLVVFNAAVALGTRLGGRARALIALAALVQFVALLLTLTRGAWLAVIAGLVAVCLLIRNRTVAVAAVLLVAGLVAFTFVLGRDDGRALSITELLESRADRNVSTRLVLWDIAWKLFLEHPVTGVGMGDFETEAEARLAGRSVMTATDAHNAYLQVLATRGLVGFVPFLLFWFVLLRELFKAKGRSERGSVEWGWAVGAIGVAVAVLFGALTELNIDDEEVFIAFMFLTGLARSAMYTPSRSRRPAPGARASA
jgi:O-antigen ligase